MHAWPALVVAFLMGIVATCLFVLSEIHAEACEDAIRQVIRSTTTAWGRLRRSWHIWWVLDSQRGGS